MPDYALGSDVAALDLAFNFSPVFPAHYANGALVPFWSGKATVKSDTFVGGLLTKDGETRCRLVGVAFDSSGARMWPMISAMSCGGYLNRNREMLRAWQ